MSYLPQIYIRQMRYDEARNKLLQEIEKFFYQGVSELEIVHGIGNYILRRMAEKELAALDYVQILEAGYYPNPGSMRVRLLIPDPGVLETYRG
jgi:dsDNA-specific endonuclease/ATPase MutS2